MTDQELNEATAKKLGKSTVNIAPHQATHAHRTNFIDGKVERCLDGCDQDVPSPYQVPDYCHSIKAAWDILDYLHRSLLYWNLYVETGGIHCWLGHKNKESGNVLEIADTAPMAIVRAFLKLGAIN